MTEVVDLACWQLELRNRERNVDNYVDSSFCFRGPTIILPNQTLLLVSGNALVNNVPRNRVYNLWRYHRDELGLTHPRESNLLSVAGFYLKLLDSEGKTVDAAGNVRLVGRGISARRHIQWQLPEVGGNRRYSIVRQFATRRLNGTPDSADDGAGEWSWRIAEGFVTYYGAYSDRGSPAHRQGGPLPVSLSSFRAVGNQTTGHVDITWRTESELNNAGFNIYRSESKTGDFKIINVKGIIAGHGTTSEQHVYTFTDTTVKPNIVYYYQIEDVCFVGNRTTLVTTRLQGNVSSLGKAVRSWADLKSAPAVFRAFK